MIKLSPRFASLLREGGVIALLISQVILLMWVELKYPFQPGTGLWLRSGLMIMTWLLLASAPVTRTVIKRLLPLLLIVFGAAGFAHLVLNSVDVYHLGERGVVNTFCSSTAGMRVCATSAQVFFLARIYRFITFSALIFLQPLLFLAGSAYLERPEFRSWLKAAGQNVSKSGLQLFTVYLVLVFTQLALQRTYADSVQAVVNWSTPFDDRFTYKLGGASFDGWIWPYTQFIKQQTSEDTTIVMPPQTPVWKMEGNEGYLRWFLYPRTLMHLTDKLPDSSATLLLVQGSCRDQVCNWPNFEIPSERIESVLLIDRETQAVSRISASDFTAGYPNSKWWGILRLKAL